MKSIRTYYPVLLPLILIAAGVFGFFAAAPGVSSVSAPVSVSVQEPLPPLSPVQEERQETNGVLRCVMPGTLPPVLVSRRNGEQLPCRIMRDGNADLVSRASAAVPLQFQCSKPEFVRFEFYVALKTSLPPRAGPAMV